MDCSAQNIICSGRFHGRQKNANKETRRKIWSALHNANPDELARLLSSDICVDFAWTREEQSGEGHDLSPLAFACQNFGRNRLRCVRVLLEFGASANWLSPAHAARTEADRFSLSPVAQAIRADNEPVLGLLLGAGAVVGDMAFKWAASRSASACLARLKSTGAVARTPAVFEAAATVMAAATWMPVED